MSGFFKKALGIFVEIDESTTETPKNVTPGSETNHLPGQAIPAVHSKTLNEIDIEKFEKHFEKLFEQSNMQGPDYYEFFKMLETLEEHIKDEKTRFSAVFASLSIQGLTKQRLLEAAEYYKSIIVKDKERFEGAINQKSLTELESRMNTVKDLEKKIVDNSELIKKLTKEISDSQAKISILKNEISEEETKLISNKSGYNIACDAMLNKINIDITKIQTNL